MAAALPQLGDIAMTLPASLFDFETPVDEVRRSRLEIRLMTRALIDGDAQEKARLIILWLRTSPRYLMVAMRQANRRVAAIARRRLFAAANRARRAQAQAMRRARRTPQEHAAENARRAQRARDRRAAMRNP